jgi:hypothetical protein
MLQKIVKFWWRLYRLAGYLNVQPANFCFRGCAYVRTYIHTHTQTDIHTHTHRQSDTHKHTQTDTHTHRQTHIPGWWSLQTAHSHINGVCSLLYCFGKHLVVLGLIFSSTNIYSSIGIVKHCGTRRNSYAGRSENYYQTIFTMLGYHQSLNVLEYSEIYLLTWPVLCGSHSKHHSRNHYRLGDV